MFISIKKSSKLSDVLLPTGSLLSSLLCHRPLSTPSIIEHRCCCCSVAKPYWTLCDPVDCSMPGLLVPHYLLELPKFMSIELVMPSSHHILCCHLLLLLSVFPSIRVFSNESVLHIRYWSFSFSISPSNEYSGLISRTGLLSLQSKGLSRVFTSTTVQKHQFFSLSLLYGPPPNMCTGLLEHSCRCLQSAGVCTVGVYTAAGD